MEEKLNNELDRVLHHQAFIENKLIALLAISTALLAVSISLVSIFPSGLTMAILIPLSMLWLIAALIALTGIYPKKHDEDSSRIYYKNYSDFSKGELIARLSSDNLLELIEEQVIVNSKITIEKERRLKLSVNLCFIFLPWLISKLK